MSIIFHEKTGQFHLYNYSISYIAGIMPGGGVGSLYFGSRINDKEDFSCLAPLYYSAMFAVNSSGYSLHHIRQEYPGYGTSDFHYPAFSVLQGNGSTVSHFQYKSHRIFPGKESLCGLPSTYVENNSEAETLEICLHDEISGTELFLIYTIYADFPVITRNARFFQAGNSSVVLERALSGCIDFPESDFDMIYLAGTWARERHVKRTAVDAGVKEFYSLRGTSSAEFNPFCALSDRDATEHSGNVYGFSLVYSGNFICQAEKDQHNMVRFMMGIHPEGFSWPLDKGDSFQTPELVCVFSRDGFNGMSQVFHRLYRTRLAKGYWRDRPRPVLVNNWEATGMDFTESRLLSMAKASAELGAELFVLDDGWFGDRDNDKSGLGDWFVRNFRKLPGGLTGLSEKIRSLGLEFGIWIEPEMVNKDSDLFRDHPDWILSAPERYQTPSRNQHVLDFSRKEVEDHIFNMLSGLFTEAGISYVKWDMNRYLTECFSKAKSPSGQGMVFHSYILGVYSLYRRLTEKFPRILFESCSSGGARFDPGMLHYAPQGWTSDDTDAAERLMIQYGTSFVYPLSSMGAHVTEIPNQQAGRSTPLVTRGNVAFFGVFGYEMDLSELSDNEKQIVRNQIAFYREKSELIHKGDFYRLESPFNGNRAAWIVVSADRKEALAGFYVILNRPNAGVYRLKLRGLDPQAEYCIKGKSDAFWGNELMSCGIMLKPEELLPEAVDFSSVLLELKGKN